MDAYDIARKHAGKVAAEIRAAADASKNEADLRDKVAQILRKFAESAKIKLEQRNEYTVASGGRADAVYNRLVVEYKAPGRLSPHRIHGKEAKSNTEAISQLKDYVRDIAKETGRKSARMAGVILDGRHFIFLRFSESQHTTDPIVEVNPESTERFLKYIVSLSAGKAVIPENLTEDFGTGNPRTQKIVGAFYAALEKPSNPLVNKLYEQWKIYFSEVAGYEAGSPKFAQKEELRKFAKSMGLKADSVNPAYLFFAVHTYYALLMKLIAWLAISPYMTKFGTSFAKLASLERESLKKEMEKLERGGIFREYVGIRNFLEGDFFSWYLFAWDAELHDAVHQMLFQLSEYDPSTLELNPEQTRDLLKKLYHYLLPREIRHDLGEYYTPDWLAQLTLNRATGGVDPWDYWPGATDKRFLDPACGSGTFLVLVIGAIRKKCNVEGIDGAEALRIVLSNVVGIDLNPLAVIAARTNYLLAIKDLLHYRKEEIDLPVYLADSIITPAQSRDLQGTKYKLRTAVGVFEIPDSFATRERIDVLANVLDECVESDFPTEAFLARLHSALKIKQGKGPDARAIAGVYEQIHDLHKKGLNGIWSRIIKNAFAPLFIGRFDYIIGNPPWINWESLPDEYRTETKPLWEHYGLFPHGGMDTILGKGKKDISTLMTYVAMDRYLKPKGRLGFVITQSLLKTTGAGQGFRRFRISDKSPIRPVVVDDLVVLNPFEGATNRTAAIVLERDAETKYPVPYFSWSKQVSGSIPFDALLPDVVQRTEQVRFVAKPVDAKDPTSAWITGPEAVLDMVRKVLGQAAYEAHAGSFTGGANAVYWVEVIGKRPDGQANIENITEGAKRKIENHQASIEPDLLYPLLRGRDVQRYIAKPSAFIIMAQDPKTRRGIEEAQIQKNFPRTYSWLKRFEKELRDRAAFKRYFIRKDKSGRSIETGPFYSMFNISEYTFSSSKVVWREQSDKITAAVVTKKGKSVVPDHKLMMVSCESEDEAHFLCAALNSTPSEFVVRSYAVGIQMDTHLLENISIPKFNPKNPTHTRLAGLSKRAHELAAVGNEKGVQEVQSQIDATAAEMWGLSKSGLRDLVEALKS